MLLMTEFKLLLSFYFTRNKNFCREIGKYGTEVCKKKSIVGNFYDLLSVRGKNLFIENQFYDSSRQYVWAMF